jgi:hypothetical protein
MADRGITPLNPENMRRFVERSPAVVRSDGPIMRGSMLPAHGAPKSWTNDRADNRTRRSRDYIEERK